MLPFLIYFLPRRYLVHVCIAAILLAPVVRLILWELISWRATYHLTPARMDTIMWGVLIACAVRHEGVMAYLARFRSAINVLIVVLAVAIGANLFSYLSTPLLVKAGYHSYGLFVSTLRYSALAMMYGLLVLRLHLPGATFYRSAMEARWLGHVGVLSYAVYMYHQIINSVVHRLVHDSQPHIAGWHEAYLPVIVLGLTFIAAEMSFRLMERPVLNRARRATYHFDSAAPGELRPINLRS
jgi:peptidoglycan/LPS O-acetylase OafA/YrhL